MLKVCQYNNSMSVLSDGIMKHPSANYEVFEFNLGQARQLRCINNEKATVCGQCETCTLNNKLRDAKEWFPRLGDHSKKKLMLGLLRRFHSVDLLQQITTVLSPLLNKDFTYSRCRTTPGLDQDSVTLSSDRALSAKSVEEITVSTWKWFEKCNYWSKANFAMSLLQLCESHLLHALGTQARTLLISEEKAFSTIADDDYVEAGSIASSDYSFRTEDHPELELLVRATPDYGHPNINPLTGESHFLIDEIENDDSGDEIDIQSSITSVDPACLVIPTSAKAHSGVSKYCDFIRRLPIQITKYILNLLDEASLDNALHVSRTWKHIVQEVIDDELINQRLNEDFMLMQGASAQGANPKYAKDIDVLVPNLYSGTREVIRTPDRVVRASYRSEYSFETAYSGVSTRKVIMEERNVYCGAYNVMVLIDQEDPHRVVHTIGSKLIAIGSKDRKVRFIESESGRELKEPVITGHAGSIRCVYLCEDREYVLSGSYDTSIRMWSIKTGKCLKIFRGHRDTILTIEVLDNYMVSGAKDSSCKVWDLTTGKCHRTFKHRKPIYAVAMDKDVCITGCEGGKVKVWDIKSGELIKAFKDHKDQVTSIKFDRWHIITGSKDSYAFVYSAIGNHNRCLNALRHPKAVLCLEFMQLRVVTGSADGRLRIWNMVNGQCCRIMRGNSRSDPILSILAIGDRITLNTQVNLLVLNFEPVEWDYTLEDDKLPSLVKYESYSAAPIRQQPYSYIRAQRMKRAGATNTKILHTKEEEVTDRPIPQTAYRAPQLPHSAKTLSTRSLLSAKMIQGSVTGFESGYESTFPSASFGRESRMTLKSAQSDKLTLASSQFKSSTPLKPPLPKPRPSTTKSGVSQAVSVGITEPKSRPPTTKSGISQASVAIVEPPHFQLGKDKEEEEEFDEDLNLHQSYLKRRVSWAFDKPLIPKSKDMSLSETKSILRSQMRVRAESIVPPNFIYLTVNAIQNSMKKDLTSTNTEQNMKEVSRFVGQKKRPSSSPSKIDPRTKIPVEEMGLDRFHPVTEEKAETMSVISEVKSVKSAKPSKKETEQVLPPDREIIATPCDVHLLKNRTHRSVHPKKVKTYVPRGVVIRPVSANAARKYPHTKDSDRPVTAPVHRRPDTGISLASTLPGVHPPQKKNHGISSTSEETNMVPMLMYPKDMKEQIKKLIQDKKQSRMEECSSIESEQPVIGKVSEYNDPLRSHVKFELRTFEQDKNFMDSIEKAYVDQILREEVRLEKQKRAAWLAKIKSAAIMDPGGIVNT